MRTESLERVDLFYVADLYGKVCYAVSFGRGGRRRMRAPDVDAVDGPRRRTGSVLGAASNAVTDCRSSFRELLDHLLKCGSLSERDERFLDQVLVDGLSLRSFAAAEGVTVQAASQRLSRLRRRFGWLDRYWRSVHSGRFAPRRED